MKKLFSFLTVCFYFFSAYATESTGVKVPSIPLTAPDALISTKSFSDLPRDIISVPVLKDLLTEDFVFYYQGVDEDVLSLKGALLRIAYEYQQTVLDHIIKYIFDSPAEVALWKTSDGKLKDFVIAMESSGLKMFLESVAKVALADSQFGFELKAKINGKDEVDVYHLNAGRKIYYIANLKGKVYLFTNLERTLLGNEADPSGLEKVKTFFGLSELKGGYLGQYGLSRDAEKHNLLVSFKYLTGGYQKFFSSMKALRFMMTGGRWETHILNGNPMTTAASSDLAQIRAATTPSEYWKAIPKNASLCATVPLDQSSIIEWAKTSLGSIPRVVDLIKRLSMSTAVCWLATSKPYTPVFLVRAQLTNGDKVLLKQIFGYLVDPKINDKLAEADKLRLQKIVEVSKADNYSLTREVLSRYGIVKKGAGGSNYFLVKLAAKDSLLVFSPDAAAVDQVLATVAKKYPALAEVLGPISKEAPFYVSPEKLSQVVIAAVQDTLPASQEVVFRNAVTKYLFPNLKKMSKQPSFTLNYPLQSAEKSVWSKIFWNTNAGK